MKEKIKLINNIFKKKISIVAIAISLLIGSYLVLSEVTFAKNGVFVNPEDQKEIQFVIREFIQTEANKEVKSREEIVKEAKELLKRPDVDLFSQNYTEGIIKGEIRIPLITECDSDLNFGETERLKKAGIKIKVTEDRVCKYNDGSDTKGIYPHFFILDKKGEKWEVVSFEDGSEVKGQPMTREVKKTVTSFVSGRDNKKIRK